VSFEKRAQPIDYGSFNDTAFTDAGPEGRQFGNEAADANGANLANAAPTSPVTAYMVPKFMGPSGEGANREYVARKEGN
jgi:hypothetical protein